MRKTLRLRRETLAELGETQLEAVAGASGPVSCVSCLTCYACYSLDQCPVPTLPIRECKINGG